MKRLLVSLRVWMVFLMNWMAPGNGRYQLAAVYGNQAVYHKKAKRTAGAFSFVSRVRSADLTDETKSACGRLDKNRWVPVLKELPKRERAGPVPLHHMKKRVQSH
ncbi:hypothetical protein ICW23_07980 [Bacillus sp. 1021]|uniref:hypothetical protein n=1 Tax=Bacillus TaxID=1386 RepID=UPI0005F9A2C7|nr:MULTISPECIES: hypothetical protein [Bacillus]AVB09500.1 hypothetical protein C3438_08070 [Bacillus velezensis]MBD0407086.1 hypothetical protein [Bacillus sp. 1021]MED0770706.1 hypothetical protein [Bacillus siamensis]MED0774803.1 hypothetical protein [Bacillus siamensis]MED0779737.1 hypothetical protein [Bacillus siamensis]